MSRVGPSRIRRYAAICHPITGIIWSTSQSTNSDADPTVIPFFLKYSTTRRVKPMRNTLMNVRIPFISFSGRRSFVYRNTMTETSKASSITPPARISKSTFHGATWNTVSPPMARTAHSTTDIT